VRLALGSTNPVKFEALAAAVAARGLKAEIIPLAVGEAPTQPLSEEETRRGAVLRAEAALRRSDAELGVGLEGGVDLEGGWLTMYAAVTDGLRTALARGPGLPLPEDVLKALGEGRELGEALEERYGREIRRRGAVFVFSGGAMTRKEALAIAARLALGAFMEATP